jgi:monoterpene epsilon-lactone hydrolase
MSQEQKTALDAMLRELPLDLGGDLDVQRPLVEELMRQAPLADDVTVADRTLGGVGGIEIGFNGRNPDAVIFYLHGGAFAMGSARAGGGLAADLARRARAKAVSVDYRLAPEQPFPAAIDDGLAAYRGLLESGVPPARIGVAGESAGAGLAAAVLIAARDEGPPQPAAAVLFSPWVDLTLSSASMQNKAAVDPSVSFAGLRRRVGDYAGADDPADGRISPLFADLSGLAPLLIQAGSHEVLLDDATRLAAAAAAADVAVRLEVTPEVPHVFQAFAGFLDEAGAALVSAGDFLRAHIEQAPETLAAR